MITLIALTNQLFHIRQRTNESINQSINQSRGLSVAVYEELAPPESPRRGGLKRKGLKARALSQVVTPGSATYLMGGDVCLRANEDVDYRPARPYAAVAFSPATGYTLVTVSGFASSTSSQKEETKKQRNKEEEFLRPLLFQ